MTAELLLIEGSDSENFDPEMDEANFEAIVQTLAHVDREWIRNKAHKNKSLQIFLRSSRFLHEFARSTGVSRKLPPPEWLRYQQIHRFFVMENNKHRFNLEEIVLDETRHGFGPVDFPFEIVHGVKPIQDLAGCEASELLRNVFILQNMNHPVLRVDPHTFCQSWVLAWLRPKFVFRGLIACPREEYGLVQLTVEVGDAMNRKVRGELSVPFRKEDGEKTGRFIPFEVCSPDYEFRPCHVFLFVMAFYVHKQPNVSNPGFRIANCTLQCELPDEVVPLTKCGRNECVPADENDLPQYSTVFYMQRARDEPQYLRQLRESFDSVVTNAKKMRNEAATRAFDDVELMMGENLLEEKRNKDSKARRDELEGEPSAKRMR